MAKINKIEDAPQTEQESVEQKLSMTCTAGGKTFEVPMHKVLNGKHFLRGSAIIQERKERMESLVEQKLKHYKRMNELEGEEQEAYVHQHVGDLLREMVQLKGMMMGDAIDEKIIAFEYDYRLCQLALDITSTDLTKGQRELLENLRDDEGAIADFWLEQDRAEVARIVAWFRDHLAI